MTTFLTLWLISLTWDQGTLPAGAPPISSNRLERGTCSTGGGWGTSQQSYTMSPATSYSVNVPDGGCYAFRVYASNSDGESGPSLVAIYRGPTPLAPTTTTIKP